MQSVLRSEQCQCQCCSPTPKYRDAGPCSFARVLPHPPTVDEMAASPRGFIGLGIMGRGMAHILAAKTPIVVWNRNRDKAESFAAEALAAGAKDVTVAATAEEVVAACGVTYSMLSDMPASEARPPAAAALRGGTALPSASASGRLLPLTSACSSLKPQASSLKPQVLSASGRCRAGGFPGHARGRRPWQGTSMPAASPSPQHACAPVACP